MCADYCKLRQTASFINVMSSNKQGEQWWWLFYFLGRWRFLKRSVICSHSDYMCLLRVENCSVCWVIYLYLQHSRLNKKPEGNSSLLHFWLIVVHFFLTEHNKRPSVLIIWRKMPLKYIRQDANTGFPKGTRNKDGTSQLYYHFTTFLSLFHRADSLWWPSLSVLFLILERYYWDSNLRIPTADYHEVLHDDKAALSWLLALRRVGIVYLKGAPAQQGQVARLAERIGYLRLTFYG